MTRAPGDCRPCRPAAQSLMRPVRRRRGGWRAFEGGLKGCCLSKGSDGDDGAMRCRTSAIATFFDAVHRVDLLPPSRSQSCARRHHWCPDRQPASRPLSSPPSSPPESRSCAVSMGSGSASPWASQPHLPPAACQEGGRSCTPSCVCRVLGTATTETGWYVYHGSC